MSAPATPQPLPAARPGRVMPVHIAAISLVQVLEFVIVPATADPCVGRVTQPSPERAAGR